jgi:CubicO group peptidase (beta-lactamase class C family)
MATGVKYDSLWKEAHRSFNRGTLRVDHAPVNGDARWGLSLGWFESVREHVLDPAGIRSATTHPDPDQRVLARLIFGKTITPWALSGSPYAAAGGVWSTFEDLCRYAECAIADDAPAVRRVSWQREGATTWINGEVRAAGAAIVHAERDNTKRATAVVHALARPAHAADKIATALLKQELTR